MQSLAKKYSGNFETFVIEKLIEYDQRFVRLEARMDKLEERMSRLETRMNQIEDRLSQIEKDTAFLPKLFDAVDAFMKEILENRAERVLLSHRVDDHERRLITLEN